MKAKPWSKKAERALLHGIGFYGVEWFRRQAGKPYDYPNAPACRSRAAVYAKARALFGAGGLTRGVFTLARLARDTGYHVTQLRRAGSALNQKWKRLGPRGCYLLTDEQVEDILEWLKHDFWSKALRLYVCVWCGGKEHPHKGGGLCSRCYWQHRRLCEVLDLPSSLEAQLELVTRALRAPGWQARERELLEAARARLGNGKYLVRGQLLWVKKCSRRARCE